MNIFEQILLFFSVIAYILVLFYHIRDGILVLVPILKCRRINGCTKDNCPFRRGCRRISYTAKEKAVLQGKIEELKKSL